MPKRQPKPPPHPQVPPARGQRSTDETDAIVVEIAGIMARGEWIAGTSHQEFCIRERASLVHVQNWATQASRLLRLWQNPEEVEAKRSENVARLDALYNNNRTSNPKVAVMAISEQNALLGLVVKKHELTIAMKSYETLPREGKVQWLRSRGERLFAEADRLEGVVENVVQDETSLVVRAKR